MEYTILGKRFRFAPGGVSRNASFGGQAVLLKEGLFLVARSITTQSANMWGGLFGLIGVLIASIFSSLEKVQFPYPVVSPDQLPAEIKDLPPFLGLKEKHKIIIVQRDEILGYTSSLLQGFRLVCSGEDVSITGSKKKLAEILTENGYAEHEPAETGE